MNQIKNQSDKRTSRKKGLLVRYHNIIKPHILLPRPRFGMFCSIMIDFFSDATTMHLCSEGGIDDYN